MDDKEDLIELQWQSLSEEFVKLEVNLKSSIFTFRSNSISI